MVNLVVSAFFMKLDMKLVTIFLDNTYPAWAPRVKISYRKVD